jgi:tetratricopeptide (TPR) repeat protein
VASLIPESPLEEQFPETVTSQPELIAHHAFHAELWAKAVTSYRQAGTHAMARSAHREALACFEQALIALQHFPEDRDTYELAIDLRFDLRFTLLPLGENERIFTYMREAETLAETLDDQKRLGYACSYLTTHYFVAGDYEHARTAGERALAVTTTLGDVSLEVEMNFRLGQVYHAMGAYQQAMAYLRRNVEVPVDNVVIAGSPYLTSVFSRAWLGLCLSEGGDFSEGLRLGEEGLQVAEAADQAFSRSAMLYSIGELYLHKGDVDAAFPVLQQNLALCQKTNIRLFLPLVTQALGFAHALAGSFDQALSLLEQAVEQARSWRLASAVSVPRLSEVQLLACRQDDALELATRALVLSLEHKERGNEASALRLLGEIALHRAPPEVVQAETYYQQALTLAEELGMRPLQAHCHRGLGTLYSQTGRSEQVRAELSTAIAMYRDMEMMFWLPQTEAVLTQVA